MTRRDTVRTVNAMSNVALAYLGDYQREEEETLRNHGIRTVRIADCASISVDVFAELRNKSLLLRSKRLSPGQYAACWTSVASAGGSLLTSPKSFEIMNNFRLYYPAIRDWSPRAVTAPPAIADRNLFTMIREAGLVPPLFVRSDVESAAKYAGLEACMMHQVDLESLSATTSTLRQHVNSFHEIIVKEVFPIATTANDVRVEYRTIGANGRLIVFDLKDSSPLPCPNEEVCAVAEKALRSLAANGADGAVFVDVALGTDSVARIVECKDFVYGTISNIKAFAHALSGWGIAASA